MVASPKANTQKLQRRRGSYYETTKAKPTFSFLRRDFKLVSPGGQHAA